MKLSLKGCIIFPLPFIVFGSVIPMTLPQNSYDIVIQGGRKVIKRWGLGL